MQVKEDTEMKEKYQNSLVQEISEHKAEIQRLKQSMAQREQEHIDEMATLKKKHVTEMERQRSQYETKIDELELIIRRS